MTGAEIRQPSGAPRPQRPLLAIDTATRRAAIAVGTGREVPLAGRSWEAGYRHGEELLAVLDELLREAGLGLRDLGGVVAGTGPGAFTGLRVGLATAKGLAYGLRVPVVGVASTYGLARAALLATAGRGGDPEGPGGAAGPEGPGEGDGLELAVAMPAGPHDRYLARYRVAPEHGAPGTHRAADAGRGDGSLESPGDPVLVPGSEPLEPLIAGATLVAVDLAGRPGVSATAAALGRTAQDGLGTALLAAGREALDRGEEDDVAALVPGYVTLPRGIAVQTGAIEWSRDLR